jgi:hypothetical protein
VVITWVENGANNTDPDLYQLERAAAGSSGFHPVAVVGAAAAGVLDSGLTPGFSYDYRLLAMSGNGFSNYSQIVTASVPFSGNFVFIPITR